MNDKDAYELGWNAAMYTMAEMIEPRAPVWRDHAPAWALERTEASYWWQRGFVYGWNTLAEIRGWPLMPYVFTIPTE